MSEQKTDEIIPYAECKHLLVVRTGKVYRSQDWIPEGTVEREGLCPKCRQRGYPPHFRAEERQKGGSQWES